MPAACATSSGRKGTGRPGHFDLLKAYDPRDFRIVGEWYHQDTGRMVLFERL